MKQFTKQNLPALRNDIDRALEELGKKHGISFSAGNARFTDRSVTFKLEVAINDSGETKSVMECDLETFYPQFKGKVITLWGGDKGKVIGYKSRNRKYPFIVESRGEHYKVGLDMVEA